MSRLCFIVKQLVQNIRSNVGQPHSGFLKWVTALIKTINKCLNVKNDMDRDVSITNLKIYQILMANCSL